MNLPLVSIGVPTFNRAELLTKCLSTLLSQDYPNFEIIISDNASTDNTPSICNKLQNEYFNLRYFRTTSTIPAMKNFERVLSLSKGEYFMWASDDDQWEPNFISTLISYFESNANLVLVASEAQYMLESVS